MTSNTDDLAPVLERLRPLVDRIGTITFDVAAGPDVYTACLKASFVKAYDFVRLALAHKTDRAFFITATLRGITEEFITLRFLSRLGESDRQLVCQHLMNLKVALKAEQQSDFFRIFRPFQPVLNKPTQDHDSRSQLRAYWRANGWPKLNRDMPPTRAMAERSDPGVLEIVYDYLFRLTSSSVHFDPPILLRSGWGPIPTCRFSMHNLGPYYHAVCKIYGGYMFCLYCEAFEADIDPSVEEQGAMAELRATLLDHFRWPEMVTFEEMNITVPQVPVVPGMILKAAYDIIQQKGFLAGARAIIEQEGLP